ncbi:MAG: carbamoyltransferase HypF [Promethearchaeota archaeon]
MTDITDYVEIVITGIVQGVGFRPFLYNFLSQFPVTGSIQNTGNLGVTLHLYRKSHSIQFSDFFKRLKENLPPIAYIEEISIRYVEKQPGIDYSKLTIIPSNPGTGKGLTLPPDISICPKCLQEFNDPSSSRFYEYPFIACAECGPRFTIMRALPYDRPNSTVNIFPFCEACNNDYHQPSNRRFHAQTFNCRECGPYFFQADSQQSKTGIPPLNEHVLDQIVDDLINSKIVAVKGTGGVNLICRADDSQVINTLRTRKRDRKYKPFAVMFPTISTIKRYFDVSSNSEKELQSFRRPIVLLNKPKDSSTKEKLPNNIAPGLPNVGVILPYMGIHYYIFKKLGEIPIVFTSGNESSLPMAITNEEIMLELAQLADNIYLHNREIYQRCDDSVLRPLLGNHIPIRRSRGFVPEYYKLPFEVQNGSIIAVGAELNSTGAISRGQRIFPTQHIGNVKNLATFEFLESAIRHMQTLLQIDPSEILAVAHDIHPLFQSTKLANIYHEEFKAQIYPIQHHHAHLAALLVDHQIQLNEKIVAITADGIGYGTNGSAWGGEILVGDYISAERAAWISPIPMIGGDLCAKYPDRMLLSLLLTVAAKRQELGKLSNWEERHPFSSHLPHGKLEANYIFKRFLLQNEPDIQSTIPKTSSLGRCLDAIAAGFDVCHIRSYRGEPAMRLEGYIWNAAPLDEPPIDQDISYYLDGNHLKIDELIYDTLMVLWSKQTEGRKDYKVRLARWLVETTARLFARKAVEIARSQQISRIGFTGGVAYNEIINKILQHEISKAGLEFLIHKTIPAGDAGISIGQIAITAALLQQKN